MGTATHDWDTNPTGDEIGPSPDAALMSPTNFSGPPTSKAPYASHTRARHSESDERCVHPALGRTRREVTSPLPPRQSFGMEPAIPPQELIDHLVDVYFDFLHPQIRLLHRPTFIPWVQSGAFVSDHDSALLLMAMFALASRYSDQPEVDLFDRSLSRRSTDDDGRSVSGYCKSRNRWERGNGFLCQARGLFDGGIRNMENLEIKSRRLVKPSVRFVQAAALLSYAEIGLAASSRAYSLISTTVRLAYDCGLDRIDSHGTGRSECVGVEAGNMTVEFVRKEELRRAWWAISDMENFICMTRGRPRMIDYDNCRTKLPCDDSDWFEGREVLSVFLPANLSDLRASTDLP